MNRTILLVEDSPDDASLTLRAFWRSNFGDDFSFAKDGAEALDYLIGAGRHTEPLPVVVLLDIKLPRVSGLEVLRRLRAHPATRLLPVVILTSSNEERDVAEAYALGANGYVRKPQTFEGLVEIAKCIGEYWLRVNEPPPTGGTGRLPA